ncbi:hypothetical protein FQA39_LY11786 [Lamprigera yunnana]|nr:hypothetical protein FQA39_LY11786 [Lamprigera yunnana]
MRNYWGTKEESAMKSELYGSKFNCTLRISREEYALNKIYLFKQLEDDIDERTIVHILAGQLEVEIQNKVMMDETKNFDKLLRILKAHDQCEKGREKDYASKDNQRGQYNSYIQRNYHQGNLEGNNHNYFQRTYQDNQPNHQNGNQRFQNNGRGRDYRNTPQERPNYRGQVREEGIENEWNNGSLERRVNVNYIVQQPREQEDRIERVEEVTTPDKEMNLNNVNIEKHRKVIQEVTTPDKEMNLNNVNIEEVDENVELGEENKISQEIHDEEKETTLAVVFGGQEVAVNQDTLGNYKLRYLVDGISRVEQGDGHGNVNGGFSYYDPYGILRKTEFTSGVHGYNAFGADIPVPVQDTPEVAIAKAQHLSVLRAAYLAPKYPEFQGPEESFVAPIQYARTYVQSAPAPFTQFAPAPVQYFANQFPANYHVGIGETPEVLAARAEHFAAHAAIPTLAVVFGGQEVAVNQDTLGNYKLRYLVDGISRVEQGDGHGNVNGGFSYYDPYGILRKTEFTSGVHGYNAFGADIPVPVQDTPEVAIAKAQHLSVLRAAYLAPKYPEFQGPEESFVAPIQYARTYVQSAPAPFTQFAPAPVQYFANQFPANYHVGIGETPEVLAARAEHFAAHAAIRKAHFYR